MVELEEPDKGRAWLIAVAACIINMILSGLSRMIGILYVAVIDTYGVTREAATTPFTTRSSIRGLAGPLVGILGQRFGIRVVTFCGGVLASAGAALCSIAPNLTWLAIFWGGMHGIGFALANTLFQVAVNQYFQKYRATASGIALSGACIGSMAFPFMLEALLDKYALFGTFLLLGGIVMHVLPPSLLMSSPQWVEHPEAYARLYALKKSNQSSETMSTSDSAVVIEDTDDSSDEWDGRQYRRMARTTSLNSCPIECVDIYKYSRQNRQKERESGVFSGLPARKRAKSEANVLRYTYGTVDIAERRKKYSMQHEFAKSEGTPSIREEYGEVSMTANDDDDKPVDGKPEFLVRTKASSNKETLLQSLKSIGNLYLNPMYLLISICMTIYICIFIPTLTILVDYSIDKGIPSAHGKYLINAMAIGDLVGRLCFGWVTDRKVLTIPTFMMLVLVLQGVFVGVFPVAMSFLTFMTALVLYSMTAGCLLVIFPVLVAEYVDNNKQSIGIACMGFMSGVVTFGIPPTIGYFRDYVGSYDTIFYIAGGISVMSGLFWMLKPIKQNCACNKTGTEREKLISPKISKDCEETNR